MAAPGRYHVARGGEVPKPLATWCWVGTAIVAVLNQLLLGLGGLP